MAFVDQSKKARIAAALKKAMPNGWKYSLAVRHYSTIVLTIQSAPVDILANAKAVMLRGADITDYLDVNEYWLDRQFSGELLETFERIKAALNTDNYDKSDIQTDYFNVGHYVDIKIGRWNKPFVYKPGPRKHGRARPNLNINGSKQ